MQFSSESKMKFPNFFFKKKHKPHLLFDLSTKEEH